MGITLTTSPIDIVEALSVPTTKLRHQMKLGQQSSNPPTKMPHLEFSILATIARWKLIEYIQAIEKAAGKEAILDFAPTSAR